MSSTKRITFTGSGVNGSSLRAATINVMRTPAEQALQPATAGWPFARLLIDKKSIEFRMPYIHKDLQQSEAEITLNKLGYLYFRSSNSAYDFGFWTLRIDALLHELREHGYTLDESCKRNLRIAKVSIFSSLALGLAAFIAAIVVIPW